MAIYRQLRSDAGVRIADAASSETGGGRNGAAVALLRIAIR
jgi:hypothetical protein